MLNPPFFSLIFFMIGLFSSLCSLHSCSWSFSLCCINKRKLLNNALSEHCSHSIVILKVFLFVWPQQAEASKNIFSLIAGDKCMKVFLNGLSHWIFYTMMNTRTFNATNPAFKFCDQSWFFCYQFCVNHLYNFFISSYNFFYGYYVFQYDALSTMLLNSRFCCKKNMLICLFIGF